MHGKTWSLHSNDLALIIPLLFAFEQSEVTIFKIVIWGISHFYHCCLFLTVRGQSVFDCDMWHITLIIAWLDIACSDAQKWYKLEYYMASCKYYTTVQYRAVQYCVILHAPILHSSWKSWRYKPSDQFHVTFSVLASLIFIRF